MDLEHRLVVLHCTKDLLTVAFPQDLVPRFKEWLYVTGSSKIAKCNEADHLYRRIKEVKSFKTLDESELPTAERAREEKRRIAEEALSPELLSRAREREQQRPQNQAWYQVDLITANLESPQHVFKTSQLRIKLLTKDWKQEEVELLGGAAVRDGALTARGDKHSEKLGGQTDAQRRLGFLQRLKLPKFIHVKGLDELTPKVSESFREDEHNKETGNSMVDFDFPESVSHYNWDVKFKGNSSENPQFMYKWDGGRGYLRFFKPYINTELTFNVNVSSQIEDLGSAPHVQIQGHVEGFADMDIDVAIAADFERDSADEVMDSFLHFLDLNHNNIPFFKGWKTDKGDIEKLMKPITFHVGGTPWTILPSFKTTAKFYHIGFMKGSMRSAFKGKMLLDGDMCSDSEDFKLKANMHADMKNVHFSPPTWLVQTKHFEMGLEIEPKFSLKGSLGGLAGAEYSFGLTPYYNITLHQPRSAKEDDDSITHPLVIYPYMVTGLPAGRSFEVRISANGKASRTGNQFSSGLKVIEYTNRISHFDFGPVSECTLKKENITVEILENGQSVLGIAEVQCTSVQDGKCQPNPLIATLKVEGHQVLVYMKGIWDEDPLSPIELDVRALSLQFPAVSLTHAKLLEQLSDQAVRDTAELRLYASGKSYVIPLKGKEGLTSDFLASVALLELGPVLLDAWQGSSDAGPSADGRVPRLDFVVERQVVGSGSFPPISWKIAKEIHTLEDLEESECQSTRTIAVSVDLAKPKDLAVRVGSAQVEVNVMPASRGAAFVYPWESESLPVGIEQEVSWVIPGSKEGDTKNFQISAFLVYENHFLEETRWHHSAPVECREDSKFKIHRNLGKATPCVYSTKLTLTSELAGETLVFTAIWYDAMGSVHILSSVPFSAVAHVPAGSSVRHLGTWSHQSHTNGTQIRTDAELEDMRKHCSPEPLKFAIGAGVNLVQQLDNPLSAFGALVDPSLAGLGEAKHLRMPPVPIWRLGEDEAEDWKLSELLPRGMCAGGVCEGMMPGCSEVRAHAIPIKKVDFKLCRDFELGEFMGAGIRHIIAYGLSVLPAAIEVEEKKYSSRTTTEVPPSPRAPLDSDDLQPRTGASDLSPSGDGSSTAGPTSTLASTSTSEFLSTVSGHQRQLKVRAPTKDPDLLLLDGEDNDFQGLSSVREFSVRFKEPLPYELTEERLRALMEADAFRGLQDAKGPVTVESFQIHYEVEPGPVATLMEPPRAALSTATWAWAVAALSAAALGTWGLVRARWRSDPYEELLQNELSV